MSKRKGFRLPERVVTIVFEDEDGPYVGLEVEVSLTTTIGYLLKATEWADTGTTPELLQVRDAMQDWARGQLRGWNLEDHTGTPIPATPEAFAERLDIKAQAAIVRRWRAALTSPPGESSPPSPVGGTSVAE